MSATERNTALNSVISARVAIRDLTERLPRYVTRARANGATWQQVGDALAITKQAAQQRYGKP